MTLVLEAVQLSPSGTAPFRPLFEPLSLCIDAGQTVTLMGASGSGKSSLLDFICGTLDPVFAAEGRVLLRGQDLAGLAPEHRRIGILFQDDLLFPHLSVAGNLAFGLPRHLSRAEKRSRIEAALQEADLVGMADRDPATLSGGQRARAAVMRVLLSEPHALLLDEPFAKLDAALRSRFRSFLFDHVAAAGLPCLLVTHDAADAAGSVVTLDEVPS